MVSLPEPVAKPISALARNQNPQQQVPKTPPVRSEKFKLNFLNNYNSQGILILNSGSFQLEMNRLVEYSFLTFVLCCFYALKTIK